MNNQFQNNNNMKKIQDVLMNPQALKTETGLKWGVAFLLGAIPMLICWVFFRSTDPIYVDTIFGPQGLIAQYIQGIPYSITWAIAFGALGLTIVSTGLVIKFSKNVKMDIWAITIGMSFAFANFYLFPFIDWWRFLTLIPMYLFGVILSQIVLLFFIIRKAQNMFKEAMENHPGGHPNNPGAPGRPGGKPINPFDQFNKSSGPKGSDFGYGGGAPVPPPPIIDPDKDNSYGQVDHGVDPQFPSAGEDETEDEKK